MITNKIEGYKLNFKAGEKITGEIVLIDKKSIFVDIQSTSEGVINREELVNKDGELTVKVGDSIEAYYIKTSSEGIFLTIKMSGNVAEQHLSEAFSNKIPVDGKVLEERKGGFTVKIGNSDAFCPYSQISLRRQEASSFIGNSYPFIIQEMNSRNLVVSRRVYLEKEKESILEKLKESLSVGDNVTGTVIKVLDFGAFVDLDGTDGFIPVSELSWSRSVKAKDVVSEGDTVDVVIKNLDWKNDKITLSFKSAKSPWSSMVEQYSIGSKCQATITNLQHFGAFAEINEGVEGLIHISKLGAGRRINHPKEVVKVGDILDVEIDNINFEKQQISLTRGSNTKNTDDINSKNFKIPKNLQKSDANIGSLGNMFDDLKL